MTDTKQPIERILGDQRIFQAVVNDLKMKHELVELADGTHRYVYTYDGVDPYEMEDSELPLTVQLIHQYGDTRELEGRIDELSRVQLDYGRYRARTFITGEPQNLLSRIAELKKTKEERQ